MTDREELTKTIAAVTDTWDEPLDEVHDLPPIVNAVLSAGWSRPRVITTVEELDALRLPAVIDARNGGLAKVEFYYGPGRQKYVEFLNADDENDTNYGLADFASFALPATVLFEGEA